MKTSPAPKVVRFPGIMRDARELGVSRIHLYLVLSGKRVSRRLTARYRALHGKKPTLREVLK
jgi:hypothetical protein